MKTIELITYGNRNYETVIKFAAVCCGHVHWREKLVRPKFVSCILIEESITCPVCKKQLVFGKWDGELNHRECGKKHLGEILAQFNRPCKVVKTKKYWFDEIGKVWLVRIFKYANGIDADYYVVPHDNPTMSGYKAHFKGENDFNEYMKLISQTEFDCYFTSQKFDL